MITLLNYFLPSPTNFCRRVFFLAILVDNWLGMLADVLSTVLFFSPQGVDSAILASQPFLLITKPTEENRTHPPRFRLTVFLLLLLRQFWSKDTDKTASAPEKDKCAICRPPSLPSERNSKHSRFSICSPVALRNVLSRSTSSAEPCSWTPHGFIYMYFHTSFLYVTAALVWQQVTKGYRFSYGHQVRCHHTKQSQFPWAAYDMHCWSNVLPRVCHCSDINIFFFLD